jgi:hypothetical protein
VFVFYACVRARGLQVAYYQARVAHVRSKGGVAVALNPGTPPDESYVADVVNGPHDFVVVFGEHLFLFLFLSLVLFLLLVLHLCSVHSPA